MAKVDECSVFFLKAEMSSDSSTDDTALFMEWCNEEIGNEKTWNAKWIKTLNFTYKNIDLLEEKLLCPDNYSGIIFTSPRCVNAVHKALSKEDVPRWKNKSNFVVGETTHKTVLEKLGLECDGKESGNALNLSQVIIKGKSNFDKPFLYPCGSMKTNTLETELSKENLHLDAVNIYDTISNPFIHEEFIEATSNYTQLPEFVIFFSPTAITASLECIEKCLEKQCPDDENKMKFVAIGPTTEKAMKEKGLRVHTVAKKPTFNELMDALRFHPETFQEMRARYENEHYGGEPIDRPLN